jgi:ATP-dependent DNA helicase RecG
MVGQKAVDAEEIQRILALTEGHFLDVKRVEVSPAKLSESISAFANTAGGELFIGIGEVVKGGEKFWNGFAQPENANGLFQVIEAMAPLRGQHDATLLSSAGAVGHVLHLIVPKTRDIVFATDGHPYVRRNAQNLRVTDQDGLNRLRLDKGINSFEDERVNVSPETITNSAKGIEFILNVVPLAEPSDWMKKQNLVADGRPVVAGVLLFADEPQAALPKRSGIKLYRYKTREEEGARDQLVFQPITIEGPAYDLISEAVRQTKRIIEEIKVLTPDGMANVAYPDETLHEIITNAVLHRDYSMASDIHIRIYENRIEVESPGRLAGHVTTENLLSEQFARNPKLVRLINKFPDPPNKDVGEGLNTAFEAMKQRKLKAPEIVETDHGVIAHIRHAPLASPEDAVMEYLKDHDEITNRKGREITAIKSENVMKDAFLRLKKRQLLEPVPGKRGNASAWRKYTGYWASQPVEAQEAAEEGPHPTGGDDLFGSE